MSKQTDNYTCVCGAGFLLLADMEEHIKRTHSQFGIMAGSKRIAVNRGMKGAYSFEVEIKGSEQVDGNSIIDEIKAIYKRLEAEFKE